MRRPRLFPPTGRNPGDGVRSVVKVGGACCTIVSLRKSQTDGGRLALSRQSGKAPETVRIFGLDAAFPPCAEKIEYPPGG